MERDDLLAHRADLRQRLGVALIATEAVQSPVTQGNRLSETTLRVAVEAINIAMEEGRSAKQIAVRLAHIVGLIADADCGLSSSINLALECLR
jgi:hypothetical protein